MAAAFALAALGSVPGCGSNTDPVVTPQNSREGARGAASAAQSPKRLPGEPAGRASRERERTSPGVAWRGIAKVGLIESFHGPNPSLAMQRHTAAREALMQRNAQGGVNGVRLELASLDDWGDPATSRRRLAELVADELVVVAIGDAALAGTGVATATSAEGAIALIEKAAAGGPLTRAAVLRAS